MPGEFLIKLPIIDNTLVHVGFATDQVLHDSLEFFSCIFRPLKQKQHFTVQCFIQGCPFSPDIL